MPGSESGVFGADSLTEIVKIFILHFIYVKTCPFVQK